MSLSEWSLVLFTILAQISVGIMATVLLIEPLFTLKGGFFKVRLSAGTLALGCMAVALIFSFLHLGSPFKAYYALSNVVDSWLSREIFFASLYLGLLFLWWMALRRTWLVPRWLLVLQAALILTGLLLIYSMAMVYMIPTVPLWNSPSTFLQFFATAFLLGPLTLLGILFRPGFLPAAQPQNYRAEWTLVIMILLFAGIRLMTSLGVWGPVVEGPAAFGIPAFPLFFRILNMGLLLTASLIIGWWAYQVFFLKKNIFTPLWWAFILILSAELIGRYFFYALYYRIGL